MALWGRGRESRAEERRHAPSRRLRYRSGAYHGMLPRHREREGMLHVPKRHQSCGTVKSETFGSLFFVCRVGTCGAFFFFVLRRLVDGISHKSAFFSCVCADFFVPLQRKLKISVP